MTEKERLAIQEKISKLVEDEKKSFFGIFDTQNRMKTLNKQLTNNFREQNDITQQVLRNNGKINKAQEDRLKSIGKENKLLEKQVKNLENIRKTKEGIINGAIRYVGYLMDADKAIRQTNLNLGLSGKRSAILRQNFEDSAVQLSFLGSNLKELAEMQTIYSDATGRQTLLYKEAAIAITRIAKGTSLGVQGSSELAGNLELMGINAEGTASMVQNIVDSSERFGVNSNKILKTMNANFKRFASYGFKTGVAGMADMAMYSEKFKVSMESTLNAADKARTLEGAVELASKLQILGGEFAKTDPFNMLYESRNDPKKFMQSINQMTKGMATLRKTADGFEFDLASPQSRDILMRASEALGMSTEELTQQAIQMSKIQEMRRQYAGIGLLNPQDREAIEGMAQFEKGTGKFYVMLNNNKRAISELTQNEIKQLQVQKTSLEDRARAAMNFDEQLKGTVEGLKATFLPLLRGINGVLEYITPFFGKINKFFDSVPEWGKEFMAGAGALLLGAVAITKAYQGMKSIAGMAKAMFTNRTGGSLANTIAGNVPHSSASQPRQVNGRFAPKGKGKATGGGGIFDQLNKINPRTILAMGAAMVGLGFGIKLASDGISNLSNSLKSLDVEQLDTLKSVMTDMSIMFGVFAVGLTVVGFAGTGAAPALLAFGAAVLMIGGGIGIAAAGLGYMSEGMSSLMKSIDPNTITQSAIGIAGIAGSLLVLSTTGLVGMLALTGVLKLLSSYGSDMERVGNAFKNIGSVLSADNTNMLQTANAIKTIAEADISNNSALAKLSNLFNKPLKVEFDTKDVALNVSTTINMDGRVMATSMVRHMADVTVAAQKGRS